MAEHLTVAQVVGSSRLLIRPKICGLWIYSSQRSFFLPASGVLDQELASTGELSGAVHFHVQ